MGPVKPRDRCEFTPNIHPGAEPSWPGAQQFWGFAGGREALSGNPKIQRGHGETSAHVGHGNVHSSKELEEAKLHFLSFKELY